MTGAYGPYKLGGSATEWYQSDRYKVFVVLFESSSKFCLDLNFQETPDFQYLNFTLKTHFKI